MVKKRPESNCFYNTIAVIMLHSTIKRKIDVLHKVQSELFDGDNT